VAAEPVNCGKSDPAPLARGDPVSNLTGPANGSLEKSGGPFVYALGRFVPYIAVH